MTGLRSLALVTLVARLAYAQPAQTSDDYHRAGEAAYKSGDFAAAVSAFEEAYRIKPRPQTLFSLAQAYRQIYVEHHEPGVLLRAVELYRQYLVQVPRGGRSEDAHELLANLDPLAQLVVRQDPSLRATALPAKTQLLVWSAAEAVTARMDGGPPVQLPHVAEVAPGAHSFALTASGYAPASVHVTAVENQLVPIEAHLTLLPAQLSIVTSSSARLVLDGVPRALASEPLQLAPGKHRIWLGARGRLGDEREVSLAPGATQRLEIRLATSPRRTRARWLIVATGVLATSGIGAYGYARIRAADAEDLYGELARRAWTTAEFATYEQDRSAVDHWQTAAAGLLITSVLTGALATWWWFDDVPSPTRR
jgi:tetratricopeptide (TPR) repeat protein